MRAENAAATAAEDALRAAAFAEFDAGAFVATQECNEHAITWNYTYTEGEIVHTGES